ncbi:flagellar basal body P-ring protein FlgI [Dyella jiangningensis]|uniref:Flagellar P-ring protein n=1 Tax=Dyella jiangningensis TaxID=1379159 RepID=A0A328P4M1_9GAMM|nr:flagellar basal body P-ring protein FlgI [Dyella jiangningensis]RAO77218.1 flagellar biosynthesis protein FlgI [Dyella jiangningensis]
MNGLRFDRYTLARARQRAWSVLRGVAIVLCASFSVNQPVHADKIRDLAQVGGVRTNQLIGYGLVVGLDGSGDQTTQAPFTTQSLENMLVQFGITVPANVRPQLKNAAAVTITAQLPPFAKPGQTIDVTVASIGNAKSIRGGELLMTPLRGADGNVYAMAQGSVVVGGISAQGKSGSSVQVNISASGRVPNGATVERSVASSFANSNGDLMLNLNTPDFTTATRIAEAVNRTYGAGTANAVDGGSVAVRGPADPAQRVAWLGAIQALDVNPGDAPARVVVNSRTGTVVIGSEVRVTPAAVAHGAIQVTITEQPSVSQPEAFSKGQTVVVPNSSVQVSEDGGHMFKFGPGTNLDTIVRAVNQVGASPSDLISILQALKQAGALHAELVVI